MTTDADDTSAGQRICTIEAVAGREVRLCWRPGTQDRAIFHDVVASYRLHELFLRWPRHAPLRLVDIGAHIGSFAVLAAIYFPNAVVDAVEMLAANVELIRANADGNGVGARVRVQHAVVADGGGFWDPRDFVLPDPANTGGACAALASFAATPQHAGAVAVVDLQGVVAGGDVDLLKLDCEGSEYRILFAGSKALRQVGMLVGELHVAEELGQRRTGGRPWRRQEFLACLASAGFGVATRDRRPQPYGFTELFLASREPLAG